nr:reverse transcriptase domain-containing protein [Tanacetum cinerariifolium]
IEWQRYDAGDLVTTAFGRIHALKARDRARPDDLEDTGSIEMAMIAMIWEVAEEQSALLNSHIKTVGHDVAYEMTWKTLKKMMIDKYCPRSEIKKLEIKIWNLNVKGTDAVSYTQCFQELALKCGRMFVSLKIW